MKVSKLVFKEVENQPPKLNQDTELTHISIQEAYIFQGPCFFCILFFGGVFLMGA